MNPEQIKSVIQMTLSEYYKTKHWIPLSEKTPTVKEHGDKVLLYRITTDSQKSMAITVHDTAFVKHCDPKETWWMPLPEAPNFNN